MGLMIIVGFFLIVVGLMTRFFSIVVCFPSTLASFLSFLSADFHGAVTYAFDGIFSWQMYGSAEAVDEGGKAYTVRGSRATGHRCFLTATAKYFNSHYFGWP